MIGQRIARARAAAGLSLRELAAKVGVSAPMIQKYEQGTSVPGSARLQQLAAALGVRVEFLLRPAVVEIKDVEYRKRANAPKRLLERFKMDVLEQAERWQELALAWHEFPARRFQLPDDLPARIASMEIIEDVADGVRREWALGQDAIPSMIDLLEERGFLVILSRLDDGGKLDGLQASVADHPVILVSKALPGDRQRFTLAHELGHRLLAGRLSDSLNEEKCCHRFAGALLLPAAAIRSRLGQHRADIELRELYLLKHEFGLSMQACLFRAADLGIIEQDLKIRLFRQFSARGWRSQEPGEPVPAEHSVRFEQLVYRALAEGWIGESKAAELMGLSALEFHRSRRLANRHAVAHQ